MERYLFVVDDRPFCAWDWDLRRKNQQFLRGIDPDFFEHQAQIAGPSQDGAFSQMAALSLRLAYSHALETFFAWAAAAFQAPQFPLGWLLQYKPGDVPRITRKISSRSNLLSRLTVPTTWKGLATAVVEPAGELTPEQKVTVAEDFGALWSRFAADLLDEGFLAEYNSLKHGLRAAPGGFVLRIGIEPSYGVAPPESEMSTIAGSEFGTSSYRVERPIKNGIDFRPRRAARNWHPLNLYHGLDLLSMSFRNLLAYLQAHAGIDPILVRFRYLPTSAEYHKPWELGVGSASMDMDTVITPADMRSTTKAEVLATYVRSS